MPGLESESAILPAVVALPESNRSPLPLGGVSGVPTLIQSRCGNKGNFELVTPMASGGLAHYWRNNDDPFLPWFGPIRFGQEAGCFEAVGMIQSNFGDPGNLEVVGRIADRLVFFWRYSGPPIRWNGSIPIVADGVPIEGVTGNPALIQSRCGNKGNFELVTPVASGGLAHYWRNNDDPAIPWHGPRSSDRNSGLSDQFRLLKGNLEMQATWKSLPASAPAWTSYGATPVRRSPGMVRHQSQPRGSALCSFRAVSAQ